MSSPIVPPDDADGTTVPRRGLRARPVAVALQPAPRLSQIAVAARLEFDDGRVVEVGTGVLVGRRPASTAWDGLSSITPVTCDDGRGAVSRNHLEVIPRDGEVLVRDRHSHNGTVVRRTDHSEQRLRGGEAVAVHHGDLVLFANRWARVVIDGEG